MLTLASLLEPELAVRFELTDDDLCNRYSSDSCLPAFLAVVTPTERFIYPDIVTLHAINHTIVNRH